MPYIGTPRLRHAPASVPAWKRYGVYGGAIGYLGWNGEMDTAIAIRTAILKDGLMHVQAGAGVVADI